MELKINVEISAPAGAAPCDVIDEIDELMHLASFNINKLTIVEEHKD